MAVCEASQPLLQSAFEKVEGSIVSLVVDNFAKGVSEEPGAITIHTRPEFSHRHWDKSDNEVLETVLKAVETQLPGTPLKTRVHRWRFSRVVQSHPERYELSKSPGLLAFAGDGFAGNDIEGAILSGMAAAKAVLSKLR
jgi:predicted NAD/FAD-dependent oxidoreductase